MSYIFVQAGVFMGFSITSAVFGGAIIISYSIAIAVYRDDYQYYYDPYYDYSPTRDYYHYNNRRERYHNFDAEMALSAIILILGIVEFAIGIWAAVCLCMMKPCSCCYGNPPQQVSYPTLEDLSSCYASNRNVLSVLNMFRYRVPQFRSSEGKRP